MKVTDLAGQRLTFLHAAGRHLAKIISSVTLCIGYIMVAFTEKNQGLHDMIAGTLVVKGAATGEPYRVPPPPPDFGYRDGTLGVR